MQAKALRKNKQNRGEVTGEKENNLEVKINRDEDNISNFAARLLSLTVFRTRAQNDAPLMTVRDALSVKFKNLSAIFKM